MSSRYENPLCRRYAGQEMQRVFSDDVKFSAWRRLWIALAESQRELGLAITQEQLAGLRAHADDIDYEAAARYETETRHDLVLCGGQHGYHRAAGGPAADQKAAIFYPCCPASRRARTSFRMTSACFRT